MKTVTQYGSNRYDFARDSHALHESGTLNNCLCAGAPCETKEVKWNNSAEDEDGKSLLGVVGEDPGEHESQHAHRDDGVKKRPKDSERHVPVADLEVFLHQIREQK